MAWNSDGTWTAEDDSVSKQVTGLMSQDSALMRQAKAAGTTTAARRGLLNSSIAAGASQNAALGYVTPIASQQAQQIATANNNAASIKATADNNAASIASQEKISANTLAAQERATVADLLQKQSDTYTSGISNTLSNADIPSATRNAAQADMASMYAKSVAALQNLYGVTLNWGTTGSASSTYTPNPTASSNTNTSPLVRKLSA